jgi:cysteinyl-tRNA synthetase
MQIKFFNTLTNRQEDFIPIDNNRVKMYVCGPTVYDRPHLGNARSIVIYDLLYRFLKFYFDEVIYIRNITDVDDKINEAAIKKNISIKQLTDQVIIDFNCDISALNVLDPTFQPKATEHIDEMIKIIETLINNKNAYAKDNHILFDVSSYQNYGQLSNRNIEDLISGARVEIADYKDDPLDFVLWKPASFNDDPSSIFDSPFGKGRPGWHIECSAMSSKYLSENFDIHGGGADLQFPHHENEIAQSKCAFKNSNYANYWIHNGFLTVNGEKMSKSLNNFFTVKDLLDQKISGLAIRFLLLSTNYRKPLDFNQKAIEDSEKNIKKFYSVISKNEFLEFKENHPDLKKSNIKNSQNSIRAISYLADDLNISKVFALLHEIINQIKNSPLDSKDLKNDLFFILTLIGLDDVAQFDDKKNKIEKSEYLISEEEIKHKISLRQKAKAEKNYQLADQIRNELLSLKIQIIDSKEGVSYQKIN